MSTELTPEQLRQRTERATRAATEAARSLGLTVTDPVVLHDIFSVVVHLAPSPVVARVPVVLPPGREAPEAVSARQAVELDVVNWLVSRGLPVVPPSPLVPSEPVIRDGFSITMWELVDLDPTAELDVVGNARDVPRLHQVLRDYPKDLAFLPQLGWVPAALRFLADNPELVEAADVDRAMREWEVLEPLVTDRVAFEERFGDLGVQPLHGDAPAVNMLVARDGKRYADFEDPVLGPVEWDLALMGPEAAAAYDESAAELGLRRFDPEVLRVMEATARVQAVACFSLVPRLPMIAEFLRYPLGQWREAPFAGGLA